MLFSSFSVPLGAGRYLSMATHRVIIRAVHTNNKSVVAANIVIHKMPTIIRSNACIGIAIEKTCPIPCCAPIKSVTIWMPQEIPIATWMPPINSGMIAGKTTVWYA